MDKHFARVKELSNPNRPGGPMPLTHIMRETGLSNYAIYKMIGMAKNV
jgi:hypothetical protein